MLPIVRVRAIVEQVVPPYTCDPRPRPREQIEPLCVSGGNAFCHTVRPIVGGPTHFGDIEANSPPTRKAVNRTLDPIEPFDRALRAATHSALREVVGMDREPVHESESTGLPEAVD